MPKIIQVGGLSRAKVNYRMIHMHHMIGYENHISRDFSNTLFSNCSGLFWVSG